MWILFGLCESHNESYPLAYFRGVFQTFADAKRHQRTTVDDFIMEINMNEIYDYRFSNDA